MFKKKYAFYYLFALLALVALLVLLFRNNNPRIDWRETYDEKSRAPYGTYVINQLLQDYFSGQPLEVLKKSFGGVLPEQPTQSNYVFIGEALFMDTASLGTLLRFVEAGNLAFISSKTIPFDLMFHLYFEECDDYAWDDYSQYEDTAALLNFSHPSLASAEGFPYQYLRKHQPESYYWSYISSGYFCELEDGLFPIGYMSDERVYFARVQYGAGFFYLHTVPLAFANLPLLEEEGLEYASRAFSHLLPGPIYWDRYSRIPEFMGRQRNERRHYSSNRQLSAESPLQYILSQPPLAWAWYLLLSLGLLYMLFRAKRRQRIIPIQEPNTNTSLEFLSTIGRLYFLQNNHKQLILQQMSLWQAFVYERYALHARDMDEALLDKLAHKSEVPKEAIKKILLMYGNVERSSFVSDVTLEEFHRLLDDFYQNCK
jgi:hypothetical protein